MSMLKWKINYNCWNEAYDKNQYTSTRLVTKGKKDFLYGRIEVKAKLPEGKGTWPAIWLMPTDSVYGDWPKSGEIDIMALLDLTKIEFTEQFIQKNIIGKIQIKRVDKLWEKKFLTLSIHIH